ncbi:hypothetical protein LRHMDP2_1144 [Lacticaseibacillus rhamnosus LRHMDP2]|uniref:Uncharacterized protein n=1 Tax=Lacticaseibacillus rhamnosus LRHMDP3 TaxID=1203259 RepID=A0AB33XXL7_LACRH|nr:hypothetical protein LRHMDP2_1144 [Lacticaseibacillus rhamnosus LRHMDP2]EKS53072.1 hypothetical protein LRHMDP3_450 [Lacticaseibacillus rhamnosus LRHMDP3]
MSLASQIHVFIAARTHLTNGRAPERLLAACFNHDHQKSRY